ncbi:MAG: M23 family metallopeptidase [Bacteroidota bacterium]|nr:M23 family metallopeptidase [Bacteroidota bacterium]
MIIRTITLTASLLFAIIAHSQPVLPDTLHNDLEFCETDSLDNTVEVLSGDSLLSNDETFYHNIWNSTQIRYPLSTLPPKDVMVTIRLAEPYDQPYVQPVIGKVISKFGHRGRRMHTGTDIKLNAGDTVRSAFDGKVRLAKRFSGYGNLVLVRHSNGLETIYAHLQSIHVNVNDTIKAGDFIGLGGRTGRATCDHLHFETRLFGEPFDSNKYIDFDRCALRSNHIYYKNKQFEIDPENFNKKPAIEKIPTIAAKVSTNTNVSKHVIRKGESLSVIARKYNTSVKNLCAVNNITAQKTLKIGSVLRLN